MNQLTSAIFAKETQSIKDNLLKIKTALLNDLNNSTDLGDRVQFSFSTLEVLATTVIDLPIANNNFKVVTGVELIESFYPSWKFFGDTIELVIPWKIASTIKLPVIPGDNQRERRNHLLEHLIISVELLTVDLDKSDVGYGSVNFHLLRKVATQFQQQVKLNHWQHGEFGLHFDPHQGLCQHLKDMLDFEKSGEFVAESDLDNVLLSCFKTWSKYSGRAYYPVPSARAAFSANEAYDKSKNGSQYVGEYGTLRMELLQHVIDELANKPQSVINRIDAVIGVEGDYEVEAG